MLNSKISIVIILMVIWLMVIWLNLSYFFYSDLSEYSGSNLKQFLIITFFTLTGGLSPLIESIFFTSQQTISVKLGYPIIVLLISGCCFIPYRKGKKSIWLIIGGTIWLLSGSIYIGSLAM